MKTPQLLFYAGNDIGFIEIIKSICRQWNNDIDIIESPGFVIISPKDLLDYCTVDDENYVCALTGWARSMSQPPVDYQRPSSFKMHTHEVAKAVLAGWPITISDITGNFSGVLYQRSHHRLKLFSDPGSIYPMYYATCSSGLLGGTHLLLLNKILNRKLDAAGLIERLSPPEFINIGSRTLLEGVRRVLPGELIQWELHFGVNQKTYDNTFFRPITTKASISDLAEMVWAEYKEDVRACVGENNNVNVGLSGGWDSRLVAAALNFAPVRSVHCFTYGVQENEYEVLLAGKVTQLLQEGEFAFCDFSSEWAPSRERFIRNLKSTESTYITEWLAILSRFASFTFEPFLLGDMFEAVAGRNLRRLSSRFGRKRLYWRRTFGNDSLPISKKGDFESWRTLQMEIVRRNVAIAFNNLSENLRGDLNLSMLQDAILSDFDEVVGRVADHDLIFTDTYDELLTWYLRCVSGTSRQVLSLNERFFGLTPTMSFRALRHISEVHPFIRVSGELMAEIQKLPELSGFAKIPNANAPFIPSNSPLWISDLVWAGRSTIDQKLIKRAMKLQNAKTRMRLINTVNVTELYNISSSHANVASWFSGAYILPDAYLAIFDRRARLKSRPLNNYDITGPASLSLILDLMQLEIQ